MFKVTEKYAEKVERLKAKRERVEARRAAEAAAKLEAWAAKPAKPVPKWAQVPPTVNSQALEQLGREALEHLRDM